MKFKDAADQVRRTNIFTTHTPVPAGNDEFPLWLTDKYLSNVWSDLGITRDEFIDLARHKLNCGETFSMPILALRNSEGRNAVSELHGQVSREMWRPLYPGKPVEEVPIGHVTNGVHCLGWMKGSARRYWKQRLGDGWEAFM